MSLIIIDVATRERRLVQVPDQGLFLQGEIDKPVCIQLHDGCFVDPLEPIGAIVGHRDDSTVARARGTWRCERASRAPIGFVRAASRAESLPHVRDTSWLEVARSLTANA